MITINTTPQKRKVVGYVSDNGKRLYLIRDEVQTAALYLVAENNAKASAQVLGGRASALAKNPIYEGDSITIQF